MFAHLLAALALLAAGAPPAPPATRLPPRPAPAAPDAPPPRIPIDLGPDAPESGPPEQIDILAPPPSSAGEIVVCRALEIDTSQLYSGSRDAWLKDYARRTQGANTIPPPDVAGPGIFRGPPTISGLCFIGPCPKDAALIVDVEAIPPPPEGSDAERVAQGLAPREGDDAPLSEDDRRRVEAELGLPEVPSPEE